MQSWFRETVEGEGGIMFGSWSVEEKVVKKKESQKQLHGKSEEWKGIAAKTCTCQTFTITSYLSHTTILYHSFYSSVN